MQTNRFDENSDLSTTYLGKTGMTRETKVKEAEEKFLISGQGYTWENFWMILTAKYC